MKTGIFRRCLTRGQAIREKFREKIMELKKLKLDFSVCKVKDYLQVNWDTEYLFIGKTDEEHSLVCPTEEVPSNVIQQEDGWRGFRIQGNLDFSLVGILSKISAILADHGISIFALSTYNTDYLLVKKGNYQKAMDLLEDFGYTIID